MVKIYRTAAASLPPSARDPNCPMGASKFILLLVPTCWANPTIVAQRLFSPFRYVSTQLSYLDFITGFQSSLEARKQDLPLTRV